MSALFRPIASDDASFEQWSMAGGKDAAMRANELWKQHLADYQDPGLDPDIDAQLKEYIARTKETLPDRDYF